MTALLADIGATNARFALLEDDACSPVSHLAVEDYASSYDAIAAALELLKSPRVPQAAMLAFAGPVDEARSVMTNAGWDTTVGELRQRFGFNRVRLMNDYAALALSLDRLDEDDKLCIGPTLPDTAGTRAVLGPGSGLGVAALIPAQPHALPLITEGGHMTMAAADSLDADLIAVLREDLGHVSAERLLSGPGLVNIYKCLGLVQGTAVEPLSPAEVTRRALEGTDALCRLTLERFCLLLGSFAGSVALSYGAQGGMFLGGGILPRFPEFLAASGFRERFEAKGRFRDYLAAIPTWLITRPDAAFVGLAAVARQAR